MQLPMQPPTMQKASYAMVPVAPGMPHKLRPAAVRPMRKSLITVSGEN